MTERGLVAIAAAGALVVAYVVYSLLSREMTAPPSGVAAPADVAEPAEPQDPGTSPEPVRPGSGRRPAPKTGAPAVRPRTGAVVPPTPPTPKVSLEEARDDYDALVAELDREAQRTEDTGRPLPSEAWVGYYTRMHEVMEPLRLHLSWDVPEESEELREKSEALRTKLDELKAPVDPAP